MIPDCSILGTVRRNGATHSLLVTKDGFAFAPMNKYDTLEELAQICARNAHSASTADVAGALWQMAQEYGTQAAALGIAPNIGHPPSRIKGSGASN
jgi:hypothetical protein